MKTRRDPLDKLFSDLIRERANMKCEVCLKSYRCNPGTLHCSHHYSRRKRSTRLDPFNASSMCFTCHQRMGENPIQFAAFIEEYLNRHYGPKAYPDLVRRQAKILKISAKDKLVLRKQLSESWAWMQAQRNDGVTARLEFTSPYEALE